jgi:hypothetical protein
MESSSFQQSPGKRESPTLAPRSLLGKAEYQVPDRFGLGAIMALLTIYSMIFAWLRSIGAPPGVYFFVGSLGLLVCLSQIVLGSVPRGASVLVGTIYLPLWCLVYVIWVRQMDPLFVVGAPCIALFGAFLGYAVGTLAAGCFMAMHLLESSILSWRGADVAHVESKSKSDVSTE